MNQKSKNLFFVFCGFFIKFFALLCFFFNFTMGYVFDIGFQATPDTYG